MRNWFIFLSRSILLGLAVAGVLLFAIPQLRQGNIFNSHWLSETNMKEAKVSYKDAIASASPAVVNIYTQSLDTRPMRFRRTPVQRTSLGSGVIMSKDGYLLTCYHVIQNAERILALLQDGRFIQAKIVGVDYLTDLAVLKIEGNDFPVVPQLESNESAVGDKVFSIGNPYNLGQTVTSGIISVKDRNRLTSFYANFLVTDAVMNEGMSGGALIDSNGHLVGINNAKVNVQLSRRTTREVDGTFLAMPVDTAKKVMHSIIENGRVIRGYLGIQPAPNLKRINSHTLATEPGIRIESMTPQSPAVKAGLRVNDVIFAINGDTIYHAEQALSLVEDTKPGTELMFSIIRDEQLLEIPVAVEELTSVDL